MTIWFGGDYNPEQWPREVWDEDVRLMQQAGITIVTVGVFSWAKLEPRNGKFNFEWLDDVLNRLHNGGIGVDLATATASPPPWMALEHPDILPITSSGVRLGGGSRQHYSPHSSTYRRYAARLVGELADRYLDHPAVVAWHVNNEYGCHVSRCYSGEGAVAFRAWLANRYGDIHALNDAWGTAFWSQHYETFDEIEPPRDSPTHANPTQLIDFDRFSSDALLDLFRMEAKILRTASPKVPITTNFMGAFKPLDYWAWAREVDFVSDDSYPDPVDPDAPASAAMTRDLMRSLASGQPWILMEQAPSAVNWRIRNAPKPPGANRVLSLQALARGANGIMYFQWRQSTAGSEKFHSGMIPHAGIETRVFREIEELGAELKDLARFVGTSVPAKVGIVLDWDSWWALEQPSTPTLLSYIELVTDWYRSFWDRGVTIDFVSIMSEVARYEILIVPSLHVASQATLGWLDSFADQGGTLVVTFQSAILDERLHVQEGGYLGLLQRTLGVTVEEFAPFAYPEPARSGAAGSPTVRIAGLTDAEALLWSEYIHVVDAVTVATFDGGDVAGWPAITRRATAGGSAWYVGTHLSTTGRDELVRRLVAEAGIAPLLDVAVDGVEAVLRGTTVFVINHRGEARSVSIAGNKFTLEARETRLLEQHAQPVKATSHQPR